MYRQGSWLSKPVLKSLLYLRGSVSSLSSSASSPVSILWVVGSPGLRAPGFLGVYSNSSFLRQTSLWPSWGDSRCWCALNSGVVAPLQIDKNPCLLHTSHQLKRLEGSCRQPGQDGLAGGPRTGKRVRSWLSSVLLTQAAHLGCPRSGGFTSQKLGVGFGTHVWNIREEVPSTE